MNFLRLKTGFTLIELLIVVAIIAILAAIAVPNFMEAQVRAKIARAKNDLRVIHTGLETYQIDNNRIPNMNGKNFAIDPDNLTGGTQYKRTLERLTSPIAYLNSRSVFSDPFPAKNTRRLNGNVNQANNEHDKRGFSEYFYAVRGVNSLGSAHSQQMQWGDVGTPIWGVLQSSGPKGEKWYFGSEINSYLQHDNINTRGVCLDMIYNATNGTISAGTVVRVVGRPSEGRGSVLGKVFQQVQDL